ncbi:MAG: alanine racemase [Clostridiales bacterium]|jgi:alanine racemase|nr:alanine racemase [Clostridiales bacterium]
MFKPSKLYVDIAAIKHNLTEIQKAIGKDVEIMPVLKAHAYGIGCEAVSRAVSSYRIAAVATVAEAIELDKYFGGGKFVMYQPSMEEIPEICKRDFEIAVANNIEFLETLNGQATKPVKIHINIETGSGILGVHMKDLAEFCAKIKGLRNIKVNGIFMHYSCSESVDESDIEFSNEQSEKFEQAIKIAEGVLGDIPYKHAGCSSATFAQAITRHNLVRMGLLIYGYGNEPHLTGYITIKPSLRFTTRIIQVENFPEGSYFGYGRTYKAKRDMKVATVSAGYADGISRKLTNGGALVVNGQKAPVVGRVCMDLTMIDVTDIKGEVKYGDEAAIFDNDVVTINEFAKISETNLAECMMHIGDTVERVIIG